jgi:hypothetical protein
LLQQHNFRVTDENQYRKGGKNSRPCCEIQKHSFRLLFLVSYRSHFLANSCTLPTHVGTFSTMLHSHSGVLFALFGTSMTDIRANTAELLTEAPTHTHYLGGCVTDGSTFEIKLDAGPERVYLLFVQAGHSTMVAFHSTCLAGFNTLLILLM